MSLLSTKAGMFQNSAQIFEEEEEAAESQGISLWYPHNPRDVDTPIHSNVNYNCIYCWLFSFLFLNISSILFYKLNGPGNNE